MTTKPKARKFRIRRTNPTTGEAMSDDTQMAPPPMAAAPQPRVNTTYSGDIASPTQVTAEAGLDTVRAESLTGRQLRMARRVAMKHGLAVTSDFDAVVQLRNRGIDPFERSSIIELVMPETGASRAADPGRNKSMPVAGDGPVPIGRIQLPQTIPQQSREIGQPVQANPADRRAAEIAKIQRDLVKRRRRKVATLFTRLAVFVGLPTLLCGFYFFAVATPMFATKTEFVIQKAESSGGAAAGGLGGLFQGTSLATSQDSITVQSYLTSPDAMLRLDETHAFKAVFSDDSIDPIQRLAPDASNEQAYKVFQDHIKVAYDPTEGIIKMEVIAPDPQISLSFSNTLLKFAEERVDQLTQRIRDDSMQGAEENYRGAEDSRVAALEELVRVQTQTGTLETTSEASNIFAQISALETEKTDKVLELASLQSVRRPNQSRVNAAQNQIASLELLIANLRSQLTASTGNTGSLANNSASLRITEENYQVALQRVVAAQTALDAASIEANRQVRYLLIGVSPVAPDEAAYPKAFENTVVAFLIFAGLYLMISLTASILREQVTS